MLSESAAKQDQPSRFNSHGEDPTNKSIQLPEITSSKGVAFNGGMTHEEFMNLRDGYAKKLPGL